MIANSEEMSWRERKSGADVVAIPREDLSATNELRAKADSFADETDLSITSRGFMRRVRKTLQEVSVSTNHFI